MTLATSTTTTDPTEQHLIAAVHAAWFANSPEPMPEELCDRAVHAAAAEIRQVLRITK